MLSRYLPSNYRAVERNTMPHCENNFCNKKIPAEEVRESEEGHLLCEKCAKVTPLHTAPASKQGKFLGRNFDYGFAYTKQQGIQAQVSLGGASLNLSISPEELARTLGPDES